MRSMKKSKSTRRRRRKTPRTDPSGPATLSIVNNGDNTESLVATAAVMGSGC